MKSKRGVYYELKESTYTYEVEGIKFYFSSLFNLTRFSERWQEEVAAFNQSANNIYKNIYNLDFTVLALVRLYLNIEKRGFYLIYKGEEVTWLNNLTFVLDVVKSTTTSKKSGD